MLTQVKLQEKFTYNKDTGIFTRLNSKRHKLGTEIKGYLVISIDYKRYPAHVLAWLYHYGVFPVTDLDHKDHNGLNNSIDNLREVSVLENMQSKKLYKCNKSGHHGVIWNSSNNNWRARIGVEGKTLNLGSYQDINDAIAARKAAEVKYGFHSNHGIETPNNGQKDKS